MASQTACTHCQAQLTPSDNFCTHCGASSNDDSAVRSIAQGVPMTLTRRGALAAFAALGLVATGAFAAVRVDDQEPTLRLGTWAGTVYQESEVDLSVTVELKSTSVGSTASVSYDNIGCYGQWRLLEVTDELLTFEETLDGECDEYSWSRVELTFKSHNEASVIVPGTAIHGELTTQAGDL